jgi:hypothetical protein
LEGVYEKEKWDKSSWNTLLFGMVEIERHKEKFDLFGSDLSFFPFNFV